MAPIAADTAPKHISLNGNISALASVLMMALTRNFYVMEVQLVYSPNSFASHLVNRRRNWNVNVPVSYLR